MRTIQEKQYDFFKALEYIQEGAVVCSLSNSKGNDNIENLLYNVTFEVIVDILTLIDGYGNESVKLDLIDKETAISIRTGIELHDKCVDFLKHT